MPFNSQQEFLKSYPEIVKPLVPVSGGEVKYGPLLNSYDSHFLAKHARTCEALLTDFFKIEDARIIRVKAIKALIRKEGDDLRQALFGKTLELCKESLPSNHHAMILHDELPGRKQQILLFDRFKEYPNFQNCIFVHSDENPFIQFADFVASICYRYYHFQKTEYKNKQNCASLVDTLFKAIDERYPPVVELSEHQVVGDDQRKGQALKLVEENDILLETAYNIVDGSTTLDKVLRRKQALQLASEHDIRFETAYQIVDKNITLEEVLRQKQTRAARR